MMESLYCQQFPERDTISVEKIIIDHADQIKGTRIDNLIFQRLSGNVNFHQGEIVMKCREASFYKNNVEASGDIFIQRSDTSSLFSDSLSWVGDLKLAELFRNVVLVDGTRQLFTDYLRYDLHYEIASYYHGAIMEDGNTQLRSRKGHYFRKTGEVFFKDKVEVVDSSFSLQSDSLLYLLTTKKAIFPGPTLIQEGERRMYAERGWYLLEEKIGSFSGNVQYQRGSFQASGNELSFNEIEGEILIQTNAVVIDSQRVARADCIRYLERGDIYILEGHAFFREGNTFASGDTIIYYGDDDRFVLVGEGIMIDSARELRGESIFYDGKTREGMAKGKVFVRDSIEKTTLLCDSAYYNRATGVILGVGGRPLMLMASEDDTLFMSADTFFSFKQPLDTTYTDSSQVLTAYPAVKIYKKDMQGVADSFVYHSRDSAFYFFKQPYLWTDTTQFSGEEIKVEIASGQINHVFIDRKAMVITSPDAIYFNQVKGKQIDAGFKDNALQRTDVYGNAEALYYLLDEDDAYIGANQTVSSKLSLLFEENQVTDIYFYEKPTGTIDPMGLIPKAGIQLEGFHWEVSKRPASVMDLNSQHLQRIKY